MLYEVITVSHLPMQLVEDRWVPDFEALETQAPDADLLLLCNPHNPGGTVFTRDELLVITSYSIHYTKLYEYHVAHHPIQEPARLLGIDPIHIQLGGVLKRLLDRNLGDLVEESYNFV